jgi:hypothetical protein
MFREFWFAGATRRYWWATALLMAGYVPVLLLAIETAPRIASPWLRGLAALAPVPFLAGFAWLEYARIRRTDELRQRMELEAGLLALVASVLLTTVLGLLDKAGVVRLPLLAAAPLACALYVGAQAWAHRRYR